MISEIMRQEIVFVGLVIIGGYFKVVYLCTTGDFNLGTFSFLRRKYGGGCEFTEFELGFDTKK